MTELSRLRVKIFADGADLAGMVEMYANPIISGFTTNPTLMRKAGVEDYLGFARDVLAAIPDRPISFEVFSDDFAEMGEQALELAALALNVNVKVPITNTARVSSVPLLRRLASLGVRLNVTALTTVDQVRLAVEAVREGPGAFISVFAGRIADTGRDPVPMMAQAVEVLAPYPHVKLLWASPRELLNIVQADVIGCHIITVTNDILKKLTLLGKDLDDYSLETVRMFHDDAVKAGYRLNGVKPVAATTLTQDPSSRATSGR